MKQNERKTRIILSCVNLAVGIAFLGFSLKKVLAGHADWTACVWVFSGLTLYNLVVILLMTIHLKKTKK